MDKLLVGLDVGGTKCAVITGRLEDNGELTILEREAFATPVSQEEAIQRMGDLVEKLTAGRQIASIGISAGSPMDQPRGMLLNPPNLPGWTGISMTDRMTERFGVPSRMENDANAGALAEYRFGAGKGSRNMAFLTFGTGLGAGLVLEGQMYRGSKGNAGELGHWRLSDYGPAGYGKMGSFEGFCSGGGMAKLAENIAASYRQMGKAVSFETYDVKTVAQAARKGDPAAMEVFDTCGKRMGQGLSLLIDLLDLDCIVLGSIYVRCNDLIKASMEAAIAREILPNDTRIVPAQLSEQIGDYAALTVAAMEV